jgi:hypothetical protein
MISGDEDRARRWRLTGNYGTFVIQRVVEAADEDAAFMLTGIGTTLTAAGWTMVEPPEGEEWDITEIHDHTERSRKDAS